MIYEILKQCLVNNFTKSTEYYLKFQNLPGLDIYK